MVATAPSLKDILMEVFILYHLNLNLNYQTQLLKSLVIDNTIIYTPREHHCVCEVSSSQLLEATFKRPALLVALTSLHRALHALHDVLHRDRSARQTGSVAAEKKKFRQSFGCLSADLVLAPALWVVRASLSALPGVVAVVVVVATPSTQCGCLCHANSQSKCSQNHLQQTNKMYREISCIN